MTSMKVMDPCPKCGRKLGEREGAFYWHGQERSGAYCDHCNSVWPIEGQEIPPLDPIHPRNDWNENAS